MFSSVLKQQAVPLVVLSLLAAVAVITGGVRQRLNRERRAFSIDHYERLMRRIDMAVDSISDTMIKEGMAVDLDELLERTARPVLSPDEELGGDDVATREPLNLTGIAWNPRMPLAFVNGRTVEQGDRIGDAEVVSIAKAHVVVRYPDGSEDSLSLVNSDEE